MTTDKSAPTVPSESAMLSLGADILEAQPFNDLVGARITHFDGGKAILELDIADRHRQQQGHVHGGVLTYLVDNTLTFACGSVLGANIVTGGLSVSYLEPARHGLLRATATVIAQTDRRAVASVTVEEISPDGELRTCAAGQGFAVATRGAAA